MTVKECYERMDADYESVIRRLSNDKIIYKLNCSFYSTDDYESLEKALEAKEYKTAFRIVHNLKGVCLNLGYTGLLDACSELCEYLRDKVADGADAGQCNEEIIKKYQNNILQKYQQVKAGIAMMDEK